MVYFDSGSRLFVKYFLVNSEVILDEIPVWRCRVQTVFLLTAASRCPHDQVFRRMNLKLDFKLLKKSIKQLNSTKKVGSAD